MKSLQGGVEPFVISSESAEAGSPGKASFDHLASWLEHEAALCLGVFNDFKRDSMLLGDLSSSRACVALIDIG